MYEASSSAPKQNVEEHKRLCQKQSDFEERKKILCILLAVNSVLQLKNKKCLQQIKQITRYKSTNVCLDDFEFACMNIFIYEPWHEISNNVVCVTSKGSDQPVHTRSLIRAFARRLNSL